jgi:hypothetical protein
MYRVEVNAGRVIEARLESLASVDEVIAFEKVIAEAFTRVGRKAIICADWRKANVLAPAVADRLIGLLTAGNPRIERSGVLLGLEHATFNLQVERVVREAASPARRTFRDPRLMEAWLGELLDADERRRVRAHLGLD